MTTYAVTASNYNSASFWNSVSESGPGHTLDFSGLPDGFKVTVDSDTHSISIWNGRSWQSVGERGDSSTNYHFGGATELEHFSTIVGHDGKDYVEGTEHDDTLTGAGGNDTLSGDRGDDVQDGGAGNDQVGGGSGNDSLMGGSGNDSILGDNAWVEIKDVASGHGATATTLTVENEADGPIELWRVNEHGDLVKEANIAAGDSLTLKTYSEYNWLLRDETGKYLEYIEGDRDQTETYGEEGLDDTIDGGTGDDSIRGMFGDDSLFGGGGDDTIEGGYGDDTIYGGSHDDSIEGGDGDDSIYGGTGTDTLHGGDGSDTLYGGHDGALVYGDAGDDVIYTGDGANSAFGGDGDDTIYTDPGADHLEGNDDADTFMVNTQWGSFDGVTVVGGEGGTDEDVLDTSMMGSGVTVVLSGDEAGALTLGGDSLEFSEIEEFDLSDQGDIFSGGMATDGVSVDGGGGSDVLVGGSGDDTLAGGQGSDNISSGVGNDSLDGGAGGDNMSGGAGEDTLLGGEGADYLSGGGDDDSVVGGDGADTLVGGAGDDALTGGDGDDRFAFVQGGGQDTISDFDTTDDDDNGYYNDQLDVSDLSGGTGPDGAVSNADVVVSDDGSGNALLTFPGGEQVVLDGVAPDDINSLPQLYAAGIPCFTTGARIVTEHGSVPVEHLQVGDCVQTADNGLQPILWIGRRDLSAADLQSQPHLAPVEISPGGVIGNAAPILVSPQHRFIVTSEQLADLAGQGEAFVRARLLESWDGAHVRARWDSAAVSYFHVMTERHEVIFADGIATETFWPGPEALRGLSLADRNELLTLFPALTYAWHLRADQARAHVSCFYSALARHDLRRKELPIRGKPAPPVALHTRGPRPASP